MLIRVPLALPVLFFAGQRDRERRTQGMSPDTHDHIQFRTALAKPDGMKEIRHSLAFNKRQHHQAIPIE